LKVLVGTYLILHTSHNVYVNSLCLVDTPFKAHLTFVIIDAIFNTHLIHNVVVETLVTLNVPFGLHLGLGIVNVPFEAHPLTMVHVLFELYLAQILFSKYYI
jgi:hypothetical protein